MIYTEEENLNKYYSNVNFYRFKDCFKMFFNTIKRNKFISLIVSSLVLFMIINIVMIVNFFYLLIHI